MAFSFVHKNASNAVSLATFELPTTTPRLLMPNAVELCSPQIYKAMARGDGRFEICRRIAQGVSNTHLKGERLSDSIAKVLMTFGRAHFQVVNTIPPLSSQIVLPLCRDCGQHRSLQSKNKHHQVC